VVDIPELQQTTGLEYTSPVQAQSVESAGLIGQGLQRTGNALIGLAGDVYDVQNRKLAARRELDSALDNQDYEEAGTKLYHAIKTSGKIPAKQWAAEFEKQWQPERDRIFNSRAKRDVLAAKQSEVYGHKVKNHFTKSLMAEGYAEDTLQTVEGLDQLPSRGASVAHLDPTQIDQQMKIVEEAYHKATLAGAYLPSVELKKRKAAFEEIVLGGINGQIGDGKHSDALKTLDKYYSFIGQEKAQAIESAIMSQIKSNRAEQRAAETHQQQQAKHKQEEGYDRRTSELIVKLNDAVTPEEKAAVGEEISRADVGHTNYNYLETRLKRAVEGPDDFAVYFGHIQDLYSGSKTIPQIRKEALDNSLPENNLLNKHGPELFALLNQREKAHKTDPMLTREWHNVDRRILGEVGATVNQLKMGLLSNAQTIAMAKITRQVNDYVRKHPNTRPEAALDVVMHTEASSGVTNSALPLKPGVEPPKAGSLKEVEDQKKYYLDELKKTPQSDFKKVGEIGDKLKSLGILKRELERKANSKAGKK